jgi:predicted nicotinamide N-methyase
LSDGIVSFAEFVLANTAPASPPLVPEITLRLATDVIPLWEKTEGIKTANPPPPYWAFAWPGGQVLARYILDNAQDFLAKSVLDFGAGSGIVGIAAAMAGAKVTASEIDPLSIKAMEINAVANKVTMEIISDDLIGRDDGWDVLCLGDMCYERPLAEKIVPWAEAIAARGGLILFGDPGRNYFPAAKVRRIATYEVPTSRDLEDRDMRETSVCVFSGKTS